MIIPMLREWRKTGTFLWGGGVESAVRGALWRGEGGLERKDRVG